VEKHYRQEKLVVMKGRRLLRNLYNPAKSGRPLGETDERGVHPNLGGQTGSRGKNLLTPIEVVPEKVCNQKEHYEGEMESTILSRGRIGSVFRMRGSHI